MGSRRTLVNRWTAARHLLVTIAVVSGALTLLSTVRPAEELDLLVVQIPDVSRPQGDPVSGLRVPSDRHVDGARIVRLSAPGAGPVNLTADFAGACDPDVSFDGQSIVFSGKKQAGDAWEIWTMRLDGSAKKQLTSGPGDKITPVFAGNRFYLDDPAPTPQIVFASTAHGWKNESADGPAWALYGMDPEGKALHRLTFNLHSDFAPDVLIDGRIVYTSWQRFGDRYAPDGLFALMGINVDGTDGLPFYGNHNMPRYKDMAAVAPTGDRVYFVESDRQHWLGGGNLAFVSRHRPMSTYQEFSTDPKGMYHSPRPLPDGGLLASFRTDRSNAVFGLYRIDPTTGRRKARVFEEAGLHTVDAQVIRTRPNPPGRGNWLIPGTETGVFYCLASHVTSLPDQRPVKPGELKFVRVIEGVPAMQDVPGGPRGDASSSEGPGEGASFGLRRLLGIAPIEPDGSFHVRVPAETPVTFQVLDENYLAVRTQKAWTWVIGNENRACIGCHEDRELSPPNKLADAILKPAVDLTLPPERRRSVDFRHQIAPILAARCATSGCHATESAPAVASAGADRSGHVPALTYRTLLDPEARSVAGPYVVPGSAIESPLIWLLMGRHTGSGAPPPGSFFKGMPAHEVLSSRERIQIIEWIDLGAAWDVQSALHRSTP